MTDFCLYRENWWRKSLAITVEIENDSKPALIADWIVVYM